MANQNNVQIIAPNNALKARACTGSGSTCFDPEAIKRAEQAMTELQGEFSDWLADDIAQLTEALSAFKVEQNAETADKLFRTAHDLKGQATTFEYPLIARVAGSLSKLMDELASREAAPLPLVTAHVDAIHVIHREQIKDGSNLTAITLAEELESKVRVKLARASHVE